MYDKQSMSVVQSSSKYSGVLIPIELINSFKQEQNERHLANIIAWFELFFMQLQW